MSGPIGRVPRVVDRWRLNGSYPPFLAEHARIYGFVLPADRDVLAELCERHFDNPSGGQVRCEPLFGCVLLTFTHIARLHAEEPPYRNVGWASETEATFWILAPRMHGFLPVRWTFFAPYIFVDLPWAIGQGREIYGFPKEVGRFECPPVARWYDEPADGPHADRFTLDTFGTQEFGASSEFSMLRLLELERFSSSERVRGHFWPRYEDASAGLHRLAKQHSLIRSAVSGIPTLWPPVGHTILLKQIPAAADGRIAAHQSIVEAGIELRQFRGGGLLHGRYQLRLRDLASHPIRRDLGLKPDTEPLAAYWMDLDFALQPGVQLYPSAEIERAHGTGS